MIRAQAGPAASYLQCLVEDEEEEEEAQEEEGDAASISGAHLNDETVFF